jgi:hypothetical protein
MFFPVLCSALTDMSTTDILWEINAAGEETDNLTTFIYRMSRNSGRLNLLEL